MRMYYKNVPVFPDVGSMTTLCPGMSFPSFSASSTMRLAMRSLTEPPAEVYSTFPTEYSDKAVQQEPKERAYTHGDCIEGLPPSLCGLA